MVDLEPQNSEILIFSKKIKISKNTFDTKKLEYKFEQSKRLPKITGFYSNSFTGYNDDFKFLQSDQKWFGSSSRDRRIKKWYAAKSTAKVAAKK